MTEPATLFRANSVSKFYGITRALSKISFEFTSGETLVLLGENGAGKSTLLSILAGIIPPDEGTISPWPDALRRGYLGQHAMLYRDLSVEENLELSHAVRAGRCRSESLKRAANESVKELLAEFSLEHFKHTLIRNCSQGVKRRVSLVRALMGDPQVLLLDEPLSHLDVYARQFIIRTLLRRKQLGISMIIATHEEAILEQLADRALVVRRGALIADHQAPALRALGLEQILKGA